MLTTSELGSFKLEPVSSVVPDLLDVSQILERRGATAKTQVAYCLGTTDNCRRLVAMKRFYFDLVGEVPARDFLGHECSSRREARKHASFIAHRIGTEHPHFVQRGNGVAVREEGGVSFYQAPIALTHRVRLH